MDFFCHCFSEVYVTSHSSSVFVVIKFVTFPRAVWRAYSTVYHGPSKSQWQATCGSRALPCPSLTCRYVIAVILMAYLAATDWDYDYDYDYDCGHYVC